MERFCRTKLKRDRQSLTRKFSWIAVMVILSGYAIPLHAQQWIFILSNGASLHHPRDRALERLTPGQSARRAIARGRVSIQNLAAPPQAKKGLKSAMRALRQKKYSRALRMIDRAARFAPRWSKIFLVRGYALMKKGLMRPAFASLMTALRLRRGNGMALTAMAQWYDSEHLRTQEMFYLNQATASQQPPWQAYFIRSILELKERRPHAALYDAWRALRDQPPGPPIAYVILGNAYARLGHPAVAVRQFQKYLSLRPHGSVAQATGLVVRNLEKKPRNRNARKREEAIKR